MSTNTKDKVPNAFPTPGPWHIGAGNGEGSIFSHYGRMRAESGGTTLYPICTMVRGWNDAEDDANARLVAAAPEMLHALYRLIHVMADEGDVDHAKRLIAKINGGAK